MPDATLPCPSCQFASPVPTAGWSHLADATCPRCRTSLLMAAYPRLVAASPVAAKTGRIAGEGEAVCKFYPDLQAEVVCDECGCLLSRRAAVDWSSKTLCFPCLHQLREKKGAEAFSARRTLHDNTAIAQVLFLAPFSFLTAPISLFRLIRHRKDPPGLVPRGPFRWWFALVISIVAIAGWLFLVVAWIAMIVRAVAS